MIPICIEWTILFQYEQWRCWQVTRPPGEGVSTEATRHSCRVMEMDNHFAPGDRPKIYLLYMAKFKAWCRGRPIRRMHKGTTIFPLPWMSFHLCDTPTIEWLYTIFRYGRVSVRYLSFQTKAAGRHTFLVKTARTRSKPLGICAGWRKLTHLLPQEGGASPRIYLLWRTKFIAWCMRHPIIRMLTGPRIVDCPAWGWYYYMDAPHGPKLNAWRKSLTVITQECCELYWTSPGGNTQKTAAVRTPTTHHENYPS